MSESELNQDNVAMIPLIFLPDGAIAEIVHIYAGARAARRLSGLGLTPGTVIRKISQAPLRGPVQIEARGTRIAIGRGLASKIIVKPRG